jgi:RND family efflux transporter MFP subunit
VQFDIRSPIAGTLVASGVTSGQTTEEGAPLFTIIDLTRVWVVAQVFEPDIPQVVEAAAAGLVKPAAAALATFEVAGYPAPFTIDATNGRLVTVGHLVDPETRTVDVIFERDNPEERLRIGQFVDVAIAAAAPENVLAIPDDAVIDEAGRPIAYVMVEGESFERRPLALGIRSDGFVEVLGGIAAGEHVVTVGGYEIRLTAASGIIPAHGHAH